MRIPFPIEIGKEWHTSGIEIHGNDTGTVNLNGKVIGMDSVSTPAGKFNAVKIQSMLINSAGTKNEITEWYANGIGMVKMHVSIEGGGIMGTVRDLLGYDEINFVLKEIDSN